MSEILWHIGNAETGTNPENASNHWQHFNVNGHNVLDLGCGRWYTTDFNEFTPIYFKNMGAKKIIGIDLSPEEIDFFSRITHDDTDFIFICKKISSAKDIKDLLNEYSITAIKCDIEEDEKYLLELTKDDMRNVTEFALEFHSIELRDLSIKKCREWGFTINLYSDLGSEGNAVAVIYCRKE